MKLTQKEFGLRVRQWRLSQNLSQHEFAALLGLSQGLVSMIENGYAPVNPMIIVRVLNKITSADTVIVKINDVVYRRDGLWFGLFLEDTTNDGLQSNS